MYSKKCLCILLLAQWLCSIQSYDRKIILAKINRYKQYEKDFFNRHQQLAAIKNPTPEEIRSRQACELGWTWARRFSRECCLSGNNLPAHRADS